MPASSTCNSMWRTAARTASHSTSQPGSRRTPPRHVIRLALRATSFRLAQRAVSFPSRLLVPTNLPFNAPAPFPIGDPRNDYFPGFNATNNTKGNPVNALTPAGFGPNSRVLMRFSVGTTVTPAADLPLLIIKPPI